MSVTAEWQLKALFMFLKEEGPEGTSWGPWVYCQGSHERNVAAGVSCEFFYQPLSLGVWHSLSIAGFMKGSGKCLRKSIGVSENLLGDQIHFLI